MHFSVESVKHGEKIKKVPLAFTTSTLQQEAAKAAEFCYTENYEAGTTAL